MKTCSKCRESKDLARFSKNKAQPDGLANQCKPCFAEGNKAWRANNKAKIKNQSQKYWAETYKPVFAKRYADNKEFYKNKALKAAFDITLEQYNEMREAQGNACKICRKPETAFKKGLAVDHCHKTGKVRGLLCPKCNVGLGQFQDNIEYLTLAASYVATEGR